MGQLSFCIGFPLVANIINLMGVNETVFEKKMKKQLKENLAMLKNILELG